MKLAIMQPYIFPYIGYFQLISAVDKFVIYDDVNFIKQGWINRNNILVNQNPFLFTVPLETASSFNKINDTMLNQKFYRSWVSKFIKTIEQNYNKSAYFNQTLNIIKEVFESDCKSIAQLSSKSIFVVSDYLGLDTNFITSSTIYLNSDLKGKGRVLDICMKEGATQYINPIGGTELYNKLEFKEKGIKLDFIKPKNISYNQYTNEEHIPWLSMIDVLMFNGKDEINKLLKEYNLI